MGRHKHPELRVKPEDIKHMELKETTYVSTRKQTKVDEENGGK